MISFLFILSLLSFIITGMLPAEKETFKPIIINAIISGILLLLIFTGVPYQTGRGTHTGIVTANTHNGIIVKTNKIFFKTDINSSQEDSYCVKDEAILGKLKEAQYSQKKVTIEYEDYLSNGIECSEIEIIIGVSGL